MPKTKQQVARISFIIDSAGAGRAQGILDGSFYGKLHRQIFGRDRLFFNHAHVSYKCFLGCGIFCRKGEMNAGKRGYDPATGIRKDGDMGGRQLVPVKTNGPMYVHGAPKIQGTGNGDAGFVGYVA